MSHSASRKFRGADLLAGALERAGLTDIYSLSGNHIMPLYDAVFGTKLKLVHVRHEAATVHMADAHARLSGRCGVALVTGGQGHTNAVAALTTAQCAESPLVLLSGHAPVTELGRGAFQELAQADLARPVTKASWMAARAENLGHDLAKAVRIAVSGRPGPVHLSLPSDLLEAAIDDGAPLHPTAADFARRTKPVAPEDAAKLVALLGAAKRPLILAGPMLCTPEGRRQAATLEAHLGVPVVGMESPRGINDPSLGAFADVLKLADLVLLLGKPHDFTLRFAEAPVVAADARFAVIDPEPALIDRVRREKPGRVEMALEADVDAFIAAVTASSPAARDGGWLSDVAEATRYRPAAWPRMDGVPGALHPLQLCRAVQGLIDRDPDSIFISDGGEIGQWAQAGVTARRRVINGVAGSIGAALPFALAARTVEPKAPVVAVMGDGTFGFHMAEIDTAVRHGLPFVCVVGNDARWGAEHQIQLRDYGAARAHGCSLLPTRYDQVAVALGGHGEFVTDAADLAPALARAADSGKPAVVNVMIEGVPAPVIRRES